MTANHITPGTHSVSGRSARLRLIGTLVLALGISGAAEFYWLGTRSPDVSGDLSMVGFNRAERRQMGQLYGKMGALIEDWSDDLKRPGTQAILIAGFSALVAAGCFYFARLLGNDEKTG